MARSLITILILFAFATQGLGGAVVVAAHSGEDMACCSRNGDGQAEAVCHTQGTNPTSSPAAAICCETFCGEGVGGSQFETVNLTPIPRLGNPVIEPSPSWFSVSGTLMKAEEVSVLLQDSPALFLQQSAFLI